MITFTMSALWLEFTLILCIYGTARTAADVEGVVRRNVGESITIQCNSAPKQESLSLKKGLNGEHEIFFTETDLSKPTINSKFIDRLQFHGKFPKVDILIKNLTLNDTGLYWCVYKITDKNFTSKTTRGSGSVLLVVTENRPANDARQHRCKESQDSMVLLPAVIIGAVLIVILIIFLIYIILKNKPMRNTVVKRQVPTNDVYEDMRGTIRR